MADILLVLLILGMIFLFLLAIGIGSNDAANSLGTPVGSKALKLKTALYLGSIFEILGVTTIGQFVSQTVRTGIIDPAFYGGQEKVYALGMFSALVGATFWLFTASYLALPVSTTHSVVGGILGFALYLNGGVGANTSKIGSIALSWVISPVSGFVVSYSLGKIIKKTILRYDIGKSNKKAIKYFPVHFSFTVSTMIIFIFESVLKSFDLGLELYVFLLIFVCSFILLFFFGKQWILPRYLKRYKIDEDEDLDFIGDQEAIEDLLFQYSNVEINEDLQYEDLTQNFLEDDKFEENLHYIDLPQFENMEMDHYQGTLPTIQDMTIDGSLSEELESTSILKNSKMKKNNHMQENSDNEKSEEESSQDKSETSSQYKSEENSTESSPSKSEDTLNTEPTVSDNQENQNKTTKMPGSGLFLNVNQWVSYSDESSHDSDSDAENQILMNSKGAKLDYLDSNIKKKKKKKKANKSERASKVPTITKKKTKRKKKKNYLKKKAMTTHPSTIPTVKKSWEKLHFEDYRVHTPKSFRIVEGMNNESFEENKMIDLNFNLHQIHPTLEGKSSDSSSLNSSNDFDENNLGFPLNEMDGEKSKTSSSFSESSLIYSSSSDNSFDLGYSSNDSSTDNENEGEDNKKSKHKKKFKIWKKKSNKKKRKKNDQYKKNEKDLEDDKKEKWKTLTLNDNVQYRRFKKFSNSKKLNPYEIEVKKLGNGMKLFLILQIFCSLFIAFGHGGNGLANSTAPLASIIGIYQEGSTTAPVSSNVYVLLGAGISASIGLMTIGKRVLLTVGNKITLLTPTGGYCAQLACALTTVIASRLGMPISTTHILIGSVMGIGVSRVGWKKGVNGKMIGRIILSWLVTLPIAGFTSLLLFSLMRPTVQNCH
ncbi:phosphate transporter [Anaeramoeba flamelloides]|uniref:Phosphate transporter n=1 Tax=Anaeramoeba flamelloides TaxID=1746091 RepID=A0ABQ8Y745_9EUKA|nr:phosphate transporter [Anaeramoeba flamelloides]